MVFPFQDKPCLWPLNRQDDLQPSCEQGCGDNSCLKTWLVIITDAHHLHVFGFWVKFARTKTDINKYNITALFLLFSNSLEILQWSILTMIIVTWKSDIAISAHADRQTHKHLPKYCKPFLTTAGVSVTTWPPRPLPPTTTGEREREGEKQVCKLKTIHNYMNTAGDSTRTPQSRYPQRKAALPFEQQKIWVKCYEQLAIMITICGLFLNATVSVKALVFWV